jgi:hypothetical protein
VFKKALALTSFSAGYVLGAHAGRERYEQIRKVVLRIKDDPHVQHALGVDPLPAEPFVPRESARVGQ